MRIALPIAALFGVRYAVAALLDRRHDADLAWQHWLGAHILAGGFLPAALGPETFTSAGSPWVPQEWALSIAVAAAANSGLFSLLAAAAAAAGIVALALTAYAARRLGASTIAAALCTACAGFSMIESYGVRAQVFAWCCLAAFMLVLRCAKGNARWWLPVITAVWANLHGSAVLAPVLLAVWTIGVAADERSWSGTLKQSLLLLAAVALATCATPLGLRLPLLAVELVRSPITQTIQEWQPSTIHSSSFAFGFLPLLFAGAICGVLQPRSWREALLFIVSAVLAFGALRNIPVAALIVAPWIAVRLTALLPEASRVNQLLGEKPVYVLVWASALTCSVVIALNLFAAPSLRSVTLPEHAVRFAARLPGDHNVLCEDWTWCSLALQYANLHSFVDGRCDAFPLPVWNEQTAVEMLEPRWRSILDRRGVTAVVAFRNRPLARALSALPDWRQRYADSTYALYVRGAPPQPIAREAAHTN